MGEITAQPCGELQRKIVLGGCHGLPGEEGGWTARMAVLVRVCRCEGSRKRAWCVRVCTCSVVGLMR